MEERRNTLLVLKSEESYVKEKTKRKIETRRKFEMGLHMSHPFACGMHTPESTMMITMMITMKEEEEVEEDRAIEQKQQYLRTERQQTHTYK